MKLLLVSLSFLTMLMSCSQSEQKTATVLRIGAAVMTGPYTGMLVLQEQGSGKRITKKFSHTDTQITLELPRGQWNAGMMVWDGATPLEGTVKCHSQQFTTTGSPLTLPVPMTIARCSDPEFGGSVSGDATDGLKLLTFYNCTATDHVTDGNDNCNYLKRGPGRSFKIAIPEVNEFVSTAPSIGQESNCLTTTPAEGQVDVSARLPIGASNLRIPLMIKSYDNYNCTGTALTKFVPNGLTDVDVKTYPDSSRMKVFFEDEGLDEMVHYATVASLGSGSFTPPLIVNSATGPHYFSLFGSSLNQPFVSTDLGPGSGQPLSISGAYGPKGAKMPQVHAGRVYFLMNADAYNAYELFEYDPSTGMTNRITTTALGAAPNYGITGSYVHHDGKIYFGLIKDVSTVETHELCSYEISTAVTNCSLGAPAVSKFLPLAGLGANLFYVGWDGTNWNVYKVGTNSVLQGLPLTGTSNLREVTSAVSTTNGIFVTVNDAYSADRLFQIIDSTTVTYFSEPLVALNSYAPMIETSFGKFYRTYSVTVGQVPFLVRPDGTTGTFPISGNAASSMSDLIGEFNGSFYFAGYPVSGAKGLYIFDGTTVTQLAANVDPINGDVKAQFRYLNGYLYFACTSGANGNELCKTDGTVPGTVEVADIYPGGNSSNPTSFHVFKDKLYFKAEDASEGSELYVYDPVADSVTMVDPINPGAGNSEPQKLFSTTNYLYYYASPDASNYQLYRIDPNNTGPVIVIGLNAPAWMSVVFRWEDRQHLYFQDSTPTGGFHLYFRPR